MLSKLKSPGRKTGRKWAGRAASLSLKKNLSDSQIHDIAASFQRAVISWIVEKTLDAARFKKVQDIVVGGGVCANTALRDGLTREAAREGMRVFFPPKHLALDNAAMIARWGVELYRQGKRDAMTLTGVPNLAMSS